MNEPKPQPWHAADEKPASATKEPRGTPIGTHSLTGGGAAVGIPAPAKDAEAGDPARRPAASEPDPLAEPRAGSGSGILGPKP